MERIITVYRFRQCWVADFSRAENAAEVYRLFDTYVIPTPWTDQAPASAVLAGVAERNPGHIVVADV